MLPLWIQHLIFEYPSSVSVDTAAAAAAAAARLNLNSIGTLSANSASSFLANDNLSLNNGLRSLPGILLDWMISDSCVFDSFTLIEAIKLIFKSFTKIQNVFISY